MDYSKFFKKELSIVFLSVVFILITIIGTTYALFFTVHDDVDVVQAGTLDLVLSGDTAITSQFVPKTNDEAMDEDGFNFKVINNGNLSAKYNLTIRNIAEDPLLNQYLMYSLDGGNATSFGGANNDEVTLISDGLIPYGGKESHNIKIWIIETAPAAIIGKNINLNLYISGEPVTFTGADLLIAKANGDDVNYDDETADKTEMFKFVHNATDQVTNAQQLIDYRFIGGGKYDLYATDDDLEEYYNSFGTENPISKPVTYPFAYRGREYLFSGFYINVVRNTTTNKTETRLTIYNCTSEYEDIVPISCVKYNHWDTVELPKVNNYINFNCDSNGHCETWRIVGVFTDSNNKKKIKIMKDEPITQLTFDNKGNGVGSSVSDYGSNDWNDAQLMYALNHDFVNEGILRSNYIFSNNVIKDNNGHIIYQLGYKPASVTTTTTMYDNADEFTWKLSNNAKKQIDKTTFYTADTVLPFVDMTADRCYLTERSNNATTPEGAPFNRTKTWDGYVGIPYLSDYFMTYGKYVDEKCYGDIFNCADLETGSIDSSSWMYNYSNYVYLNYFMNFTTNNSIWSNYNSVSLTSVNPSGSGFTEGQVRPTVYLKSDVILSGNGTVAEPYNIIY